MRALGVATIGYEFMGRAHSNAWRNVGSFFDVPPVRMQTLVGRDAARTAAAARRLGWAESATDYREVLSRDDIDIVDICTPGNAHAEITIAALEAGKHVLVEKPLANTVAEAEAMAAAATVAQKNGVRSMVGFTYRRVPALAYARTLIQSGRLGRIRQVRASYLQDWLSDEDMPMTWRLRKEAAGSGALGDIASHAVDQIQFLLDTAVTSVSGSLRTFTGERVNSEGEREPVTVDDAAWANATLANGASASIEVSRVATGRKNALEIDVYGSDGALRFDLERLNELQFLNATAPAAEQGFRSLMITEAEHPYLEAWWPAGHIIGWQNAFVNQAADFLQAIRSGANPSPSFAEGLSVQRVLSAISESAERDGVRVAVAR